MPIRPTEPEFVISCIEAVHFLEPANLDVIAEFTGLQAKQATAALDLGSSLLLVQVDGNGSWSSSSPYCALLALSRGLQKRQLLAAAVRQVDWLMYFLDCLARGDEPVHAARKTRVNNGLIGTDDVIAHVCIAVLLYSEYIVRGRELEFEINALPAPYEIDLHVVVDRNAALGYISGRLSLDSMDFLPAQQLAQLADAYYLALQDQGRTALQVGLLVTERVLDLELSNIGQPNPGGGIIEKGDALRTAGVLPQKMLGFIHLFGHLRNAADHGGDPEIQPNTWSFRRQTALLAINLLCQFIDDLMELKRGSFIL